MYNLVRSAAISVALIGFAIGGVSYAKASEHGIFTPAQEEAIDAQIRDYIRENPEVILEALRILEQRRKLAEEEKAREQLVARSDEIFSDPTSPVGWNRDGDVTIVEFFDYQCPYCKAVAPTLAQLKKEDKGIRYVYKEWPILGPVSEVAARAALAAEQQGRYERFHEALMALPGKLKEADIMEIAENVGLDVATLRRDMEDPAIQDSLVRTRALARALGITGTPAFIIGDNIVPGAVEMDRLKALIKQAREQRG
jgi:protein-disulfide isomerase